MAILTGRSRATEDIDIILESLSEADTKRLVSTLKDRGYWGMAMPLDEMYSMLNEGDRIRIAEDGEMHPNFEVWFVSNDVEREAISHPLTVEFDDQSSRTADCVQTSTRTTRREPLWERFRRRAPSLFDVRGTT